MRFTPCSYFVDKLEFRLGWIEDNYNKNRWEHWDEMDRYLAKTFSDCKLNQYLSQAHVSCWTEEGKEKEFMWEFYGGKFLQSVRVKVNEERLQNRFLAYCDQIGVHRKICGYVSYGVDEDRHKPRFYSDSDDFAPKESDLPQYLFLRKHHFFLPEAEYRFVVIEPPKGAFFLPYHDLIKEIVLSPLVKWKEEDIEKIRTSLPGAQVNPSRMGVSR